MLIAVHSVTRVARASVGATRAAHNTKPVDP
jgi:hypothetical protein